MNHALLSMVRLRLAFGCALALIALAGCGVSAAAESELWTSDIPAAMKQASAEKKDLLIDFTGSDWCHWCIKLHEEVFEKESFQKEAPLKFVLVELDFPQDETKVSEATRKQNAEWQEKLAIEGFPTVVLADATGQPYAKTGYQKGGPEKYLAHLQELLAVRTKRDAALASAKTAQGVERAKHLDAALTAVGEELAFVHYGDLVKEVISLDANNAAGLKDKYAQKLNDAEARKLIAESLNVNDPKEIAAALKKLDAGMATLKPGAEVLAEYKSAKINLLMADGQSEQALKLIDEVLLDKSAEPGARQQFAIQKASLLVDGGKTDEAIKVFDDLLKGEPAVSDTTALLHYYKAQFLVEMEKIDAAEKAFDAAIVAAAEVPELLAELKQHKKEMLRDAKKKSDDTAPDAPPKKN